MVDQPETNPGLRVVSRTKSVELSQGLRTYAEKRVARLTRFFEDHTTLSAELVLKRERELEVSELTLQVGGLLLRGVGKTPDLRASVDEAVDRIEKQIHKFRTKIHKRLQGSPKTVAAEKASLLGWAAEGGSDDLPQDGPRIVRTKRFAIKPMPVEEACMQMELLGHDFFVFTNAGTSEVNVLYRRKDGEYGLIEPEM
ncbi:MAG: ribosome-associated translation inhibitor RaiA [Firmicutes bacterium]|nr:ribosome-associated translation inhibitor RaiA [Bacillota bacterium]